jgi:opacity protein-like surface antigen
MRKFLVASVLFFILCLPAMAADGDQFAGRFGVNAGYLFFNNPAIDDNCWFAGIEYAADMWSIALDYTTPDATVGGDTEQFMMAHLDYLYYFSGEGYQMENPTYAGVGYTQRFQVQHHARHGFPGELELRSQVCQLRLGRHPLGRQRRLVLQSVITRCA